MVDYKIMKIERTKVSLRYSNNQQVLWYHKHGIYRGGVGQHSLPPSCIKFVGLKALWAFTCCPLTKT